MSAANASPPRLTDQDRRQIEARLLDFDQSWNARRLETQELPPRDDPARGPFLLELIKIDLEYQWRTGRRLLMEDYLRSYPELGTPDTAPAELLQAEYEVRLQILGAADLADFDRRFPHQAEQLRELLRRGEEMISTAELTRADSDPALAGGAAELPEQFGRYRILKKLGQGGMGAVYLAHDGQLDRQVALKVPHFKPEDGPAARQRFYREARAAATLAHPNLCPVYDVGEYDGRPYLTLAFIDGRPLSDLIRAGPLLPPRQAASLVRKLALAVQEVHAAGIIHRDLKPSNVMLDACQEPILTDFGLARRLNKGDVRLTATGEVLGSPAYMAPEQVAGRADAVGPASDVYSLGVILYELLTGQLPFQGTVPEVLGRVLSGEPEPPARHRPDLDPELDAICRKALARRIEDRYASMTDLAADLACYLDGEPLATAKTQARRPFRWRLAAGALAAVLLLGVVLYVATDHGTIKIELSNPDVPVTVTVDGQTVDVAGLGEPLRLRAGPHHLVVLGKDFEAHSQSFTVRRGNNPVLRVELQPRGQAKPEVAVGEVHCFRVDVQHFAVAFAHDGPRALSGGSDWRVRLWDTQTGTVLRQFERHDNSVRGVAFSPKGDRAVSGGCDNTARLWDVESGRELHRFTLPGKQNWVWCVAYAADGKRVLTGSMDGLLRLWDVETGNERKVFKGHTGTVRAVAFTPDGRQAVSASDDKTLRLWDVASGGELFQFKGHASGVAAVAVSADGRHLLSGGADNTLHLWDLPERRRVRALQGHTGKLWGAAFVPGGRYALSASEDRTVRLWDVDSGRELHTFQGHTGTVWGVACSPDGRHALSAGDDRTLRLWRLPKLPGRKP